MLPDPFSPPQVLFFYIFLLLRPSSLCQKMQHCTEKESGRQLLSLVSSFPFYVDIKVVIVRSSMMVAYEQRGNSFLFLAARWRWSDRRLHNNPSKIGQQSHEECHTWWPRQAFFAWQIQLGRRPCWAPRSHAVWLIAICECARAVDLYCDIMRNTPTWAGRETAEWRGQIRLHLYT